MSSVQSKMSSVLLLDKVSIFSFAVGFFFLSAAAFSAFFIYQDEEDEDEDEPEDAASSTIFAEAKNIKKDSPKTLKHDGRRSQTAKLLKGSRSHSAVPSSSSRDSQTVESELAESNSIEEDVLVEVQQPCRFWKHDDDDEVEESFSDDVTLDADEDFDNSTSVLSESDEEENGISANDDNGKIFLGYTKGHLEIEPLVDKVNQAMGDVKDRRNPESLSSAGISIGYSDPSEPFVGHYEDDDDSRDKSSQTDSQTSYPKVVLMEQDVTISHHSECSSNKSDIGRVQNMTSSNKSLFRFNKVTKVGVYENPREQEEGFSNLLRGHTRFSDKIPADFFVQEEIFEGNGTGDFNEFVDIPDHATRAEKSSSLPADKREKSHDDTSRGKSKKVMQWLEWEKDLLGDAFEMDDPPIKGNAQQKQRFDKVVTSGQAVKSVTKPSKAHMEKRGIVFKPSKRRASSPKRNKKSKAQGDSQKPIPRKSTNMGKVVSAIVEQVSLKKSDLMTDRTNDRSVEQKKKLPQGTSQSVKNYVQMMERETPVAPKQEQGHEIGASNAEQGDVIAVVEQPKKKERKETKATGEEQGGRTRKRGSPIKNQTQKSLGVATVNDADMVEKSTQMTQAQNIQVANEEKHENNNTVEEAQDNIRQGDNLQTTSTGERPLALKRNQANEIAEAPTPNQESSQIPTNSTEKDESNIVKEVPVKIPGKSASLSSLTPAQSLTRIPQSPRWVHQVSPAKPPGQLNLGFKNKRSEAIVQKNKYVSPYTHPAKLQAVNKVGGQK